MSTELAIFGAGCFWGVEAAFREVDGVDEVISGYSGGSLANPTYQAVCTDTTGHVEVVQVRFDPEVVSYEQLLDLFWTIHDPTTLNRQGPDRGRHYRSVLFFHSPEQAASARSSKEAADSSGRFGSAIVTAIEPVSIFYAAEKYHQRYFEKHNLLRH